MLALDGPAYKANRLAWSLCNGPIPNGMFVLHKCDTPSCANPDHLFLGDQFDNMRDMAKKNRHWAYSRPERIVRGEFHGLRKNPSAASRGEDRWNAVLDERLVGIIRQRAMGGEKHLSIAQSIGVSRQAVSKVVSRKTWRHVEHTPDHPTQDWSFSTD